MTCSIPDCESKSFCHTWCKKHYRRWYVSGSTELGIRKRVWTAHKALKERFFEKVIVTDNHWIWIGAKNQKGYGRLWDYSEKRVIPAHRVAWMLFKGKVPEGLCLDHLCKFTSCVNPNHLEPVTYKENSRRGFAALRAKQRGAAQLYCKHGHIRKNNIYKTSGGCKTCCMIRQRERRRKSLEDKLSKMKEVL